MRVQNCFVSISEERAISVYIWITCLKHIWYPIPSLQSVCYLACVWVSARQLRFSCAVCLTTERASPRHESVMQQWEESNCCLFPILGSTAVHPQSILKVEKLKFSEIVRKLVSSKSYLLTLDSVLLTFGKMARKDLSRFFDFWLHFVI